MYDIALNSYHCLNFKLDECPRMILQICELISWVFKEALECLTTKLLFGIPLTEFDIPDTVINNLNNTVPGYSFLTDDWNPFINSPGLLLRKVFSSSQPHVHDFFWTSCWERAGVECQQLLIIFEPCTVLPQVSHHSN